MWNGDVRPKEPVARQQFRHVQFGHGRILRFLDYEDPSLRLDHNPATFAMKLPSGEPGKEEAFISCISTLRENSGAPPNALQKERSCVLIVDTRLWSISRIASCCADSSQWQHGNSLALICGFKTSSMM